MKKVSLYANIDYSCYIIRNQPNNEPALFQEDTHNYYNGGFTGAYYTSLFHRPLILSTIVSVDAWEKGWGKLQAKMAAMTVLKQSERTKFSVGFFGMSLYHSVSIFPVIAFWYRFSNPIWSLDLTPPSQMYLRYQINFHRVSIGTTKGTDNFYAQTSLVGAPSVCYFSEVVMKPEVQYEYIINRHFYLTAHIGLSMVLKSALYNKNQKDVELTNENGERTKAPILEQDRSPVPFINVGLSYSLFK